MTTRAPTKLSIALAGDEPPTEFRIFTAGVVDTKKGKFTFDAAAAKAVMDEYQAHGIDLMIDYDHASLSAIAIDPAESGKAAGWFNLELRNGELWAVNVRWTPPAADALRAKEWRFISPAFPTDDSGRIAGLLNVAITNLPATRQLQPLMAASNKGNGMTVEEFLKVCKALDIDLSGSLEDAMAKIQGGKPAGDGDKPKDPAAAEKPAEAAPEKAAMESSDPAADKKEEKPAEVASALAKVLRLSGKTSFVAAVSDIETWRLSHLELESGRAKLAEERKVLESAERRKGCADMVALGGRAPATVWADDAATTPKAYLSSMPIAEFRAMVADTVSASTKKVDPKVPTTIVAGAGAGADVSMLSAAQLALCVENKIDPADYAALLNFRKGGS